MSPWMSRAIRTSVQVVVTPMRRLLIMGRRDLSPRTRSPPLWLGTREPLRQGPDHLASTAGAAEGARNDQFTVETKPRLL
jgi:hypothetical protein